MSSPITLAVTMGDPRGVGAEVMPAAASGCASAVPNSRLTSPILAMLE